MALSARHPQARTRRSEADGRSHRHGAVDAVAILALLALTFSAHTADTHAATCDLAAPLIPSAVYTARGDSYFDNGAYRQHGLVMRAPVASNSSPATGEVLLTASRGIKSVAVDSENGYVYFARDGDSAYLNPAVDDMPYLGRVCLQSTSSGADTGAADVVLRGLERPGGVAIDPSTSTLFFIEQGSIVYGEVADMPGPTISRVDADAHGSSGSRVDLVTADDGLVAPLAIAVDATAGHVYYTNSMDAFNTATVTFSRVDVEGGNRVDVFVNSDVVADGFRLLGQLALDTTEGVAYLAADGGATVVRVNVTDGQHVGTMSLNTDRVGWVGGSLYIDVNALALDARAGGGLTLFVQANDGLVRVPWVADSDADAPDVTATTVVSGLDYDSHLALWLPCSRNCSSCGSVATDCTDSGDGHLECAVGYHTVAPTGADAGAGASRCVLCRECSAGTFETVACSAAQERVCGGECNATCATCRGAGPTNCTSCDEPQSLFRDGSCGTCDSSCAECDGPTAYDCTSCSNANHTRFYDGSCGVCDPSCSRCWGPAPNNCYTCARSTDVFFQSTWSCGACDAACARCTSPFARDCTYCARGYYADPRASIAAVAAGSGSQSGDSGTGSSTSTDDEPCKLCECGAGTMPTTLCTALAPPTCSRCPLPGNCGGVSGIAAATAPGGSGSTNPNATVSVVAGACVGEGVDPTSFMCSQCLPGHFPLNGACRECPASADVLPAAFGLLAVGVLSFLVLKGALNPRSEQLLRQFAVHVQAINVYISFDVEYPEWMHSVWQQVQGLVLDVALFSPQCVLDGGWYLSFGLTFAVAIAALGGTVAGQALLSMRQKQAARLGKPATKYIARKQKLALVQLTIAQLAYVPLLRTMLQSMDCVDTPQGVRLQSDADIECLSTQHIVLMCVCALACVVLGVAVPVWLFWHFFHLSKKDHSDRHSDPWAKRLATVVDAYRDDGAYFEGAMLLHRAVGVWMAVSFADGTVQSIVVLLATLYLLGMVVVVRPWKPFALLWSADAMNWLSMASLGSQAATLVCGLISDLAPSVTDVLAPIAAGIAGASSAALAICAAIHFVRKRQHRQLARLAAHSKGDDQTGAAVQLNPLGAGDPAPDIGGDATGTRATGVRSHGIVLGVSPDTAYVHAMDAVRIARRERARARERLEADDAMLRDLMLRSDADPGPIAARREAVRVELDALPALLPPPTTLEAALPNFAAVATAIRDCHDVVRNAQRAVRAVQPTLASLAATGAGNEHQAGDARSDVVAATTSRPDSEASGGGLKAAHDALAKARVAVEQASRETHQAHDAALARREPEVALMIKRELWQPVLERTVTLVEPAPYDNNATVKRMVAKALSAIRSAGGKYGKAAVAARKREVKCAGRGDYAGAAQAVVKVDAARQEFVGCVAGAMAEAAHLSLDAALCLRKEGALVAADTPGLVDEPGIPRADAGAEAGSSGSSGGGTGAGSAAGTGASASPGAGAGARLGTPSDVAIAAAAAAACAGVRGAEQARAKMAKARERMAGPLEDASGRSRGMTEHTDGKAELAAAVAHMRATAAVLGTAQRRQYRTAMRLVELADGAMAT